MLQQIQDRFAESIQTQIAAADLLPEKLQLVAHKMVNCLLAGHKVIVAGQARSYANAQLLASHLLHRYDLARPSLAAQLLHFDGVLASCLAQDNALNDIYKKQLQAVAKEGDILVVFSPIGNETAIIQAMNAASHAELSVIAFTGTCNSHIQGLLTQDDCEIAIPSNNEMRIVEGHQFCINLLCELIDSLLFNPTSH